jgi:hypothetical protein
MRKDDMIVRHAKPLPEYAEKDPLPSLPDWHGSHQWVLSNFGAWVEEQWMRRVDREESGIVWGRVLRNAMPKE